MHRLLSILAFSLLVTCVWAQTESPSAPPDQKTETTTTAPTTLPQPLPTETQDPASIAQAAPGELPPLQVSSEEERGNYVLAGVSTSVSYDDNAFLDNKNKVGDVTYLLSPYIGFRSLGPRIDFDLHFGPGWSWDQRL